MIEVIGMKPKQQERFSRLFKATQKAVKNTEDRLGPDHLKVADGLNYLACFYSHQGDYTNARHAYERVLGIRKKVLGPEHPSVASTMKALAGTFCSEGNYEEAETLYLQALAIMKKTLGADHPHMSFCLYNLARTIWCQGNIAFSESVREQAFAMRKRSPNCDADMFEEMLTERQIILSQFFSYIGESKIAARYSARLRSIQSKIVTGVEGATRRSDIAVE